MRCFAILVMMHPRLSAPQMLGDPGMKPVLIRAAKDVKCAVCKASVVDLARSARQGPGSELSITERVENFCGKYGEISNPLPQYELLGDENGPFILKKHADKQEGRAVLSFNWRTQSIQHACIASVSEHESEFSESLYYYAKAYQRRKYRRKRKGGTSKVKSKPQVSLNSVARRLCVDVSTACTPHEWKQVID